MSLLRYLKILIMRYKYKIEKKYYKFKYRDVLNSKVTKEVDSEVTCKKEKNYEKTIDDYISKHYSGLDEKYSISDNIFECSVDLTFGLEIEFQLPDVKGEVIANAIVKEGLGDCLDVLVYNTTNKANGWKIIKEASCDYEIISPILRDTTDCWESIRKICLILKEYNAVIDDKCAFHIHIGYENLNFNGNNWNNLREIYEYLEPLTYILSAGKFNCVPKSRVEKYAVTVKSAERNYKKLPQTREQLRQIIADSIDEDTKGDDLVFLFNYYAKRHVGMNWRNIGSNINKTIEFRTFNATLDEKLMQTYLLYVVNIIKLSSSNNINLPSLEHEVYCMDRNEIYLHLDYIDKSLDFICKNDREKDRILCSLKNNKFRLTKYLFDALYGNCQVDPL